MTCYFDSFKTPFGPFSVSVDETGAVTSASFGTRPLPFSSRAACNAIRDKDRTRVAREQVLAYLEGRRRNFDLPLAPRGTAFQQRVWAALTKIPFGETRSYGEIARQLGKPAAARAIGRANATNPICLIVPCHRVIGADGSLTGFAFGAKLKRRLLDHEREVGAKLRAA